jgi:hypothetical protein
MIATFQAAHVVSYSTDAGPFGIVFAVIAALIVIAAWVIVASSRFVQGGVVERPERVPQLYGYTVCLVALIWGLVSAVSVVDDALSLAAPELRGSPEMNWTEPSVTSFEAFRATYDRSRRIAMPDAQKLDTIPEPELRRRYEALRADRIRRGSYEARREIVTDTLSLAIAAALFAFHWRWLRRRASGLPAHADAARASVAVEDR